MPKGKEEGKAEPVAAKLGEASKPKGESGEPQPKTKPRAPSIVVGEEIGITCSFLFMLKQLTDMQWFS